MVKELENKNLLVIVESPNKCKHVKEYLTKAGYNVNVLASVGHIMKLADGGDYYNSGISPEKNFELNLKIDDDHAKQVSVLKEASKKADLVYLMSDPDREGEVIAWSLIKFLKLPLSKVKRSITHEITPKAVVHAIENPIQLNETLVSAGLARLTIDKMIGYRLSPIAKTYIGAKSVGRCQSVGLKLVADREKEIQNFVPETYYTLEVRFKKGNSEFSAKYIGTKDKKIDKLDSLEQIKQVKAKCTKDYIIEDIQQKIREESPKSAFDTPSIAQTLYENGFITYMRTSSCELSKEFITKAEQYIKNIYSDKYFFGPRKIKNKQKEALDGHEALRCTDITLTPAEFNKQDQNILHNKIYSLIWLRTIQSLMINTKYAVKTLIIENNGELFTTEFEKLIEPGFKIVK